MRDRQELKGEYFQNFKAKGDNQEYLRHAISEAGLHCCDNCGYITDELVRFKDYHFTKSNVLAAYYNTLCDDCYEYFYSQDFVKPIKQD